MINPQSMLTGEIERSEVVNEAFEGYCAFLWELIDVIKGGEPNIVVPDWETYLIEYLKAEVENFRA